MSRGSKIEMLKGEKGNLYFPVGLRKQYRQELPTCKLAKRPYKIHKTQLKLNLFLDIPLLVFTKLIIEALEKICTQ